MKKVVLGRGLSSLLGNVDSSFGEPTDEVFPSSGSPSQIDGETKKPEFIEDSGFDESLRVWNMAIEKVIPNKNQPRKYFLKEELASLADSIKEYGILQPITVRKTEEDSFEIVAGERRWRAAQIAGCHEVPVLIKDTTEQKSMELALIENIQREDLNPIEEAKAYQFLMNHYNMTQRELSERMGKDRATIANILRLLNLSDFVKEMVLNAEISLGQAKALVSVTDFNLQKQLAEQVVRGSLTVRATENLVRKALSGFSTKEKKAISAEANISQRFIHALCEDMQKVLGTKVEISYKSGQGKMQIYFHSDEELNALADKIQQ